MKQIVVLIWSIILPGSGQIMNRKWVKGIVLMIMAVVYTFFANLTEAIIFSFQGEIEKAIEITNMQWLSFYPCLYFFAMWDAWKDASGRSSKYAFFPFVFGAYFSTVGCFYSGSFYPFSRFSGPIWLPLIFTIPGVVFGLFIQLYLLKTNQP